MKALREAISALELYDVAPGVKRHSHENGDVSAESGFWIGTLESTPPSVPKVFSAAKEHLTNLQVRRVLVAGFSPLRANRTHKTPRRPIQNPLYAAASADLAVGAHAVGPPHAGPRTAGIPRAGYHPRGVSQHFGSARQIGRKSEKSGRSTASLARTRRNQENHPSEVARNLRNQENRHPEKPLQGPNLLITLNSCHSVPRTS